MAFSKEEITNRTYSRKSFKKQFNKRIRKEAKNVNNPHPKTNRYSGWAD